MSLHAHALSLKKGDKILVHGATLSLKPGQISVLIGPNGAGKTTLLKALCGLSPPHSGSVLWQQTPLLALPERLRAQKIAYLAQAGEVAWALDVATLVGLGRLPHNKAWAGQSQADEAAVAEAMQACNVADLRHRLVPTLSGGERARVLLARALAGKPQVLLADEPLAGLDPGHQLAMIALFKTLAGEGLAILITLHDLTLAARLADDILLMHAGHIIAQGTPQAVLSPANIAKAYQVAAEILPHPHGPLIVLKQRL
jgi:iron complex transport system ATP-binding protein